MLIPQSVAERIERVHRDAGRAWLQTLPSLLAECRTRWSLQLEEPFTNLSYNLVLPGTTKQAGSPRRTELVLKLGGPCAEFIREATALSLFAGAGAARLLDHEMQKGALLLERVTPGTPLHLQGERSDVETTRTAASLMRQLWQLRPANVSRAADHSFPSLAVWFAAFENLRKTFAGGTGPFPARLITAAEAAFAELNVSSDTPVLLHGDLHHENILFSSSQGWLAIDPKGVVGDRGYEVGSFMLNQLPEGASESETLAILTDRLEVFSTELGISKGRLARWAFCHAVLSAVWSFEEADDWSRTVRLAEMLEQLG